MSSLSGPRNHEPSAQSKYGWLSTRPLKASPETHEELCDRPAVGSIPLHCRDVDALVNGKSQIPTVLNVADVAQSAVHYEKMDAQPAGPAQDMFDVAQRAPPSPALSYAPHCSGSSPPCDATCADGVEASQNIHLLSE